jgi:hypothetical protein
MQYNKGLSSDRAMDFGGGIDEDEPMASNPWGPTPQMNPTTMPAVDPAVMAAFEAEHQRQMAAARVEHDRLMREAHAVHDRQMADLRFGVAPVASGRGLD